MKLLKTKTKRFADVIADAGAPETYTLWQKPKDDRQLQSAIKSHRVMTILKSEAGRELGMAGFKEAKGARYLIFPKSLKQFENNRIVGIKWDRIQ